MHASKVAHLALLVDLKGFQYYIQGATPKQHIPQLHSYEVEGCNLGAVPCTLDIAKYFAKDGLKCSGTLWQMFLVNSTDSLKDNTFRDFKVRFG